MQDQMKSSSRQPVLPALPFGNLEAVVERDAKGFADRMAAVITSIQAYDPLGEQGQFASKTKVLSVNGVRLVAAANTPVSASVGETSDTTIMIPFAGSNVTLIDTKELHWVAGNGAVYLPSTARGGYCSARSTLSISLDPGRLVNTAQAMLGLDSNEAVNLQLDQARIASLHAFGFDFDAVFRHLCGFIDALGGHARALELSGLDDLFYRNIVLMLRPDLFAPMISGEGKAARDPQHRHELDLVCDYITAHLGDRIALSDLERVSGMSSRGLQYAFLNRFGCSPMQWLRGARLDRARIALVNLDENQSITETALNHGFSKPSDFAEHYRRRFGELPSETRARKSNRS
ncbi:MAG: hypothetical protein RLZZ591_2176 [Pseudomonadota bacterium]|jgi:AraC-like DNA-binding protein